MNLLQVRSSFGNIYLVTKVDLNLQVMKGYVSDVASPFSPSFFFLIGGAAINVIFNYWPGGGSNRLLKDR